MKDKIGNERRRALSQIGSTVGLLAANPSPRAQVIRNHQLGRAGGPQLSSCVVGSIAELRSLPANEFQYVHVAGYYSPGDGGGGDYFCDRSDATTPDDGGAVIVGVHGLRWKLAVVGAVSIKQFGAMGCGDDDTAAIDRAHAASSQLYYPQGHYRYTGRGVPAPQNFRYEGAGTGITFIHIDSAAYFIDSDAPFDGISITGFEFVGGLGAIRSKSTANKVGRRKVVRDNAFTKYTECAINTNHGDNPYWQIEGNLFDAANSVATIGIALSRNSDVSIIKGNSFLRNKVHLKLKSAGVIPDISCNDFIQFDRGSRRSAVWVFGNSIVNIQRNKFGNENQVGSDFRIVVVPELPGPDNGSRLPDYSGVSVSGPCRLLIEENYVGGASGGGPFLFDLSNDLRGTSMRRNEFTGSLPSLLIERAHKDFAGNPYENIVIEDNYSEGGVTVSPERISNVGYYGAFSDSRFIGEGDSRYPHQVASPTAGRSGYVELLATRIGGFRTQRCRRLEALLDTCGGTEAGEFEFESDGELSAELSQYDSGVSSWIEIELAQGSIRPLQTIDVKITQNGSGAVRWIRKCIVPTIWQPFRFGFSVLAKSPSVLRISTKQAGVVRIGRVRVYQSRSPVTLGRQKIDDLQISGLAAFSCETDAIAEAHGVPIGGVYRNGSLLCIRIK